ncbi:hypothetical protein [Polymorphobacter sp.]|uniref:hypothetical protein n=1 Tax=Polymorphobacter sp. TaxID=1909290 RepID=UPI003F7106C3
MTLDADRQIAKAVFHIGERTSMRLDVDVSTTGLLSIGALVSMILLSTAVVVRAAMAPRRASAEAVR